MAFPVPEIAPLEKYEEEWGRRILKDPMAERYIKTEAEWREFVRLKLYYERYEAKYFPSEAQLDALVKGRELFLKEAGVRFVTITRRGISWVQPWGEIEKHLIRWDTAWSRIRELVR